MNISNNASVTKLATFAFGLVASLAVLAGCTGADEDSATTNAAISPPSVFVVGAVAKVKPGTENDFRAAAVRLVAETRNEPGNVGDVLHQGKEDPTEFFFFEHWTSPEASDAHMHGAALGTFFAQVQNDFEPGFPKLTSYLEVPATSASKAQ